MRALLATAVFGLVAVPPMTSADLPSNREGQRLTADASHEAAAPTRVTQADPAPHRRDASDAESTCDPRGA